MLGHNQDTACRPAYWLRDVNGHVTMLRHLSNGEFVIGVFNLKDGDQNVEIPFAALGVPYGSGVKLALSDLVTGEDFGVRKDDVFVPVRHHASRILRARFVQN